MTARPWRSQLPEPARFWISRFLEMDPALAVPVGRWFVDLAGGSLRRGARPGTESASGALPVTAPGFGPLRPDSVVWIPPLAAVDFAELLSGWEASPPRAVVSFLPGERRPAPRDPDSLASGGPAGKDGGSAAGASGVAVLDLSDWALGPARSFDREREEVRAAATDGCFAGPVGWGAAWQRFAVWPLVAGVSDGLERFSRLAQELARAGFHGLRPWAIELSSADRREIVATAAIDREEDWHRLFHAAPPNETPFLAAVAAARMRPFPARPLVARGRPNERLAERLHLAAEWWQRAGRPEATAAALRAAALRFDGLRFDLESLRRDGHLRLLGDLHPVARSIAESEEAPIERELEAAVLGERVGLGAVG